MREQFRGLICVRQLITHPLNNNRELQIYLLPFCLFNLSGRKSNYFIESGSSIKLKMEYDFEQDFWKKVGF